MSVGVRAVEGSVLRKEACLESCVGGSCGLEGKGGGREGKRRSDTTLASFDPATTFSTKGLALTALSLSKTSAPRGQQRAVCC